MRKKRLFKMKIVPAATDHVADYADEIPVTQKIGQVAASCPI
jgi:hypothetical protein